MTKHLCGLAMARRNAVLHQLKLIRAVFAVSMAGCMAVLLVGCGGSDSTTSTTSNDDIAAFIEENPEFADSGQTGAQPSNTSEPTPLGLER